jgi:putative restriction endonuclease
MTGVVEPFIAQTDWAWFSFLTERSVAGRIDEANFWSPLSVKPMKHLSPGEPVFLRLKRPRYCIAGYGFFAHFTALSLEKAWEFFDWKNGDPTFSRFLERIGRYRKLDLFDPRLPRAPLGCTILRDLVLFPEERRLPWGDEQGWSNNIVRGKTETDPVRASRLLAEIGYDTLPPAELVARFELVELDQRRLAELRVVQREGQGSFRARLLDAYGRRCAITGERTEPVLDAAHIQPYLGPRSNHVQNGLLLTKEFHTLFDAGYVTITPAEHRVRVSPRLHQDFHNGKRYYVYDDKPLAQMPSDAGSRPSEEALAWHGRRVFKG